MSSIGSPIHERPLWPLPARAKVRMRRSVHRAVIRREFLILEANASHSTATCASYCVTANLVGLLILVQPVS